MSLASTWFDPCVGVDLHMEMVPTPAGPVPTPIPNPFVGMVWDPMSLLFSILGPVVINGVPANNTGTEAVNKLGVPHMIIPPGTTWTPMPKPPAPTAGKGAPEPGNPAAPDGDAVMIMGSSTVHVMGSNQVRMGEPAMSCGEPVRLPSSAVIAVPKGAPVLVGGAPSLDLMSAALAAIKTKAIAGALHKLAAKIKNARIRNIFHKGICFLTGHPVDVANGRLITDAVDFQLPGPIPVKFERNYASSWADRDSAVGHGWAHSYDQAVWIERGRVVYLAGDGREIEFDTFDLPDRVMRRGDAVWDPINRLTLRALGNFRWEVEEIGGVVHEFAPVDPLRPTRAKLVRIRSRDGHRVELSHDKRGDLETLRDCGGRLVYFEHDRRHRLTTIHLPHPDKEGTYVHARYAYDDRGDLVRFTDAYGHSWRYDYVGHLMVKETDRNGLSFYFGYDGQGPDAYCIRTWGDGGIFDHVIDYDKANRTTFVTNSCDETTIYKMDELGRVIEKIDPHGRVRSFAYDDDMRVVALKDPLGNATTYTYDGRGNTRRIVRADGSTVEVKYDRFDNPVLGTDPAGGHWVWNYDTVGRPVRLRNPAGAISRVGFVDRNPAWTEDADGVRSDLEYDGHGNLVRIAGRGGGEIRLSYDRQGRLRRVVDPGGGVHRYDLDLLGRPVRTQRPGGHSTERKFDLEGLVVEQRDRNHHRRYGYEGYYHLAYIEEAGTRTWFHHDTEGRLVAASNEAGERYVFELDSAGQPVGEVGFDGKRVRFEHDAAGQVTKIEFADGATETFTRDVLGRTTRIDRSDATFVELEYRADGAVVRAANESGELLRSLDPMRRLQRESFGADWVETGYSAAGRVLTKRSSRGAEREIERDAVGRVAAVRCGTRELEVVRDTRGDIVRRRFPGGVDEIRTLSETRAMVEHKVFAGGSMVVDRSLAWSTDERIEQIEDATFGTTTFAYDARGRLTHADRPDGSVEFRVLDAVGNPFAAADGSDRRYAAGGKLQHVGGTTYDYDERGRLIEKRDADGTAWRYTYNDASELIAVEAPDGSRTEFAYDPFGRRILKRTAQGESSWVWDQDVILHEVDDAGEATWHHLDGEPTPIGREVDGRWHSVVADQVGAPRAFIDDTGTVEWAGTFDLYGRITTDVDATSCPLRWPGQQADAETGLYYNRYRYYDPDAGTYTTPDPIGLCGGLALYGYVTNPLIFIDFFGLDGHHTVPKSLVEQMKDKGWVTPDADSWKDFKKAGDRPGMWDLPRSTPDFSGADGPHITGHKALTDFIEDTRGVDMTNGFQKKADWDNYLKSAGSLDEVMKDFDTFYKEWLPDKVKNGEYPSLKKYMDQAGDAFDIDKKWIDDNRPKCP